MTHPDDAREEKRTVIEEPAETDSTAEKVTEKTETVTEPVADPNNE